MGDVFLQKTNVRKRAKRFVWLSETKASCAHFSWMFSFQNELFCPVGKFPTQEQTSSGNQFGNLQDKVVCKFVSPEKFVSNPLFSPMQQIVVSAQEKTKAQPAHKFKNALFFLISGPVPAPKCRALARCLLLGNQWNSTCPGDIPVTLVSKTWNFVSIPFSKPSPKKHVGNSPVGKGFVSGTWNSKFFPSPIFLNTKHILYSVVCFFHPPGFQGWQLAGFEHVFFHEKRTTLRRL